MEDGNLWHFAIQEFLVGAGRASTKETYVQVYQATDTYVKNAEKEALFSDN